MASKKSRLRDARLLLCCGTLLVAATACGGDDEKQPVLSGVEPEQAYAGQTVSLRGAELEGTAVKLTSVWTEEVFDLGTDIIGRSRAEVQFIVPQDLEIQRYAVHLQRDNLYTELRLFEVVPAPVPEIMAMVPGLAEAGDSVVISGEDFGEEAGKIWFGPLLEAEVASWSDTQIDIVVPEGASTGGVYVETSFGANSADHRFAIGDASNPTASLIQEVIFTPGCARGECHGVAEAAGLSLVAGRSYEALVGVESSTVPGLLRVDPGSPSSSFLVEKISSAAPQSGERMPKESEILSGAEIQLVMDWIAAGAQDN